MKRFIRRGGASLALPALLLAALAQTGDIRTQPEQRKLIKPLSSEYSQP